MLVKQMMDRTAAVCVRFDTATGAVDILKRNDISFIPVVENEPTHMYIGAVTDRLLCLQVIGGGLDPERTQLADCISYQNVFCRPDDPIEKALQIMRRKRMTALAVLDSEGNVVGAVLLDELLKRAQSQQTIAALASNNVKPPTPTPASVPNDRPTRRASAVRRA